MAVLQTNLREAQGKLREMTEDAVHVSPAATTETPTAVSKQPNFGIRHRRGFTVAFVIGILLAMLGALQTSTIPFLSRLAYWQILMLSGAMIGLGVSEAVEQWGRLRTQPFLEMPLIGFLIALPLTLIVIGTSNMFFQSRAPGVQAFAFMFGITFVVSVAMTTLNYMIHWPGKTMPTTATPAIETPTKAVSPQTITEAISGRFAERLPLPLRQQKVIALQAEDHYLRVHLDDGQSTLILMRLSDAIAELPHENGAQTHRSWWVAKDAVQSVTKADGRATLTLGLTLEAPVSRSFYKALNDAGWLV
jgi:hypothetical protein